MNNKTRNAIKFVGGACASAVTTAALATFTPAAGVITAVVYPIGRLVIGMVVAEAAEETLGRKIDTIEKELENYHS